MLDKGGLPENSLSMRGTLGLWDIARNKIIFLPIDLIYSKQATDKELKKTFRF